MCAVVYSYGSTGSSLGADLQERMEFFHFTFNLVQINRHDAMVAQRKYKVATFQEHLLKNIRSAREARHHPKHTALLRHHIPEEVNPLGRANSPLLMRRTNFRIRQIDVQRDENNSEQQIYFPGGEYNPMMSRRKPLPKVESAFDVLVDAIEREQLKHSSMDEDYGGEIIVNLRGSEESVLSLNESPHSSHGDISTSGDLSFNDTFKTVLKNKKKSLPPIKPFVLEDYSDFKSEISSNAEATKFSSVNVKRSAPISVPDAKVYLASSSLMSTASSAPKEPKQYTFTTKKPSPSVAARTSSIKNNTKQDPSPMADPVAVAKQTLTGAPMFCEIMFS
eukprot:TRINITY_DN5766_c0_g1_i1.p1 TRINITY_DN5766_c0_g1~~TRINITY_DN5766_c0_g1_i1.p1  ORF type:complete len:335 (-),score=75.44 TRINITY_DN5766_c0_g1_i1:99-1103(-)